MPIHKDLKRLVRARMAKTGESYTTARAHVTRRKLSLPRGHQKLGGIPDANLVEKTGRTWREWVAVLDDLGATEMSHRDVARWVATHHDIGSWWSQTVTVGYERIRGLRAVGQGRDGHFTASKSRTLPFPEAVLRRAVHDPDLRAAWLPATQATPTGKGRSKDLRFVCPDGTRGVLSLVAKGDAKTTVAVGHERLPSAAAARDRKRFWEERFEALRRMLEED